jgi:hypothetical protein
MKVLVRHHCGAGRRKTGRAWKELNSVHAELVKHWASYQRACQAMENLPDREQTQLKYQPIAKADLKSVADVTNPNRIGQRNNVLPWFWTAQPSSNDPKWLDECEDLSAC